MKPPLCLRAQAGGAGAAGASGPGASEAPWDHGGSADPYASSRSSRPGPEPSSSRDITVREGWGGSVRSVSTGRSARTRTRSHFMRALTSLRFWVERSSDTAGGAERSRERSRGERGCLAGGKEKEKKEESSSCQLTIHHVLAEMS